MCVSVCERSLYLLEATLGLKGRAELLFLLDPHLDNLMQELLLGLLGVQAAVQGLPQGL